MEYHKKSSDIIAEIEDAVRDIAEAKTLHPSLTERISKSVDSLREKSEHLEEIEDSIDSIRAEILNPVAERLEAGTKFSKRGYVVGLMGIAISIGAVIISTLSTLRAGHQVDTLVEDRRRGSIFIEIPRPADTPKDRAHKEWIGSIFVNDKYIITGSDDRTIKIWATETGTLLKTLFGHTGEVQAVFVSDNRIVSGANDNSVKVWDLETGGLLNTCEGHRDSVYSVSVENGKIVTGSRDKTVRVWNLYTCDLLLTLRGHKESVRAVAAENGKVFSGSDDQTVRVWDLKNGNLLHVLEGHLAAIRNIAVEGDWLVSSDLNSIINIWSVRKGSLVQTFENQFVMGLNELALYKRRIVTVSWQGDDIDVYYLNENSVNIDTILHLEPTEGNHNAVFVFQGAVFASNDSTNQVEIWDLETGEFLVQLSGFAEQKVAGWYDRSVR